MDDLDKIEKALKNRFKFSFNRKLEDTAALVKITHNDKYIISMNSEDIKVWDIETGKCWKTLKGNNKRILSLTISNDDKYIISCGEDKLVKIWDIESGKCLKKLEGHYSFVLSVAISNDNKFIVSGSKNAKLKIWDFETGECLKTFDYDYKSINSVAITNDNKYIIFGDKFGNITKLNIETEEYSTTLDERYYSGESSIQSLLVTSDDKYLISMSDEDINVWDLESLKSINNIAINNTSNINPITMTNDNAYIIYGNNDNTINIHKIKNKRCSEKFKANNVNSIAITSDNSYIVFGHSDGTPITIWENKANDTKYIEENINLFPFNIYMKLIEKGIIEFDNVVNNLLEKEDFEHLEKIFYYFSEKSKYKEKFIHRINKLKSILVAG